MANVLVLSMALVVFLNLSNSVLQFRVLSITAVSLGLVASFFYIAVIKETALSEKAARFESVFKGKEVLASGTK